MQLRCKTTTPVINIDVNFIISNIPGFQQKLFIVFIVRVNYGNFNGVLDLVLIFRSCSQIQKREDRLFWMINNKIMTGLI